MACQTSSTQLAGRKKNDLYFIARLLLNINLKYYLKL